MEDFEEMALAVEVYLDRCDFLLNSFNGTRKYYFSFNFGTSTSTEASQVIFVIDLKFDKINNRIFTVKMKKIVMSRTFYNFVYMP